MGLIMHLTLNFWEQQGNNDPGLESPEGLARWRGLILSSQQPARCDRLCTCGEQSEAGVREDARSVGGMFSTLHAIGVCVIAAALEQCALVGTTAPWLAIYTTSAKLRASCTTAGVVRAGLPCYFEPLSHCTLPADGSPTKNLLRHNQQVTAHTRSLSYCLLVSCGPESIGRDQD